MPLDDRWVSEAIPASTVWAVPRDGYLEQPQTWRKSSAGLVPGKTVSLSVVFWHKSRRALICPGTLTYSSTKYFPHERGPGAGDAGGYVIAAGTPEEIVTVENSATGRFLEDVLAKHGREGTMVSSVKYS